MTGSSEQPVKIEDLLERYRGSLEAYLRLRAGAMIRAKESCADLAQSVCREILQHRERLQFDGEEGFRRWLFKTAQRKIADRHDYYLAKKRDVGREAAAPTGTVDSSPPDVLLEQYASLYTPSRHVQAKEELHRVEAAFDGLPADHQEVIVMARIFGMSRREIGEQTGRTEEAVRALLYRALAGLAGTLSATQP